MAVDFGLLGNPVNPLQVLQSLAMGQQQVQQRAQAEQEAQQRQQQQQMQQRQFALQERKLQVDTQKQGMDSYAEAIQDVLRRPENERPATWDAYVDQFVAMGQPEAAQLKGRYSEQAARAMLAQAGKLSDFNKASEVDYQVIPMGGKLQGFQYGQPLGGGQQAPRGRPQPDADDIAEAMRDPQAREEFKQFFGVDPASLGGQTPRASGGF